MDGHGRRGTFIVVDPLVVTGSSSPNQVEGRLCLDREYPYLDEIERGFEGSERKDLERKKILPFHPLSLIYDMHSLELIYTPRVRVPNSMFPHDEAWLKGMPGWGRQQISVKWLDTLVPFEDLPEIVKTNGLLFEMDRAFPLMSTEILAVRWEFRAMFRKIFSRLSSCELLMVWSQGEFFPELVVLHPSGEGPRIEAGDGLITQKSKSMLTDRVEGLLGVDAYKNAVMAAYCCMRGTREDVGPASMRMYCHLVHVKDSGFGGTVDTYVSDTGKLFKGDKGWTCGEVHAPTKKEGWSFSKMSTLRDPERDLAMLLRINDNPNEKDDYDELDEEVELLGDSIEDPGLTSNREEKP